jgi:hypothetical protein
MLELTQRRKGAEERKEKNNDLESFFAFLCASAPLRRD